MSSTAAEQLRRLLLLLPALADDKEHRIVDVAARLGVDRKALLGDLQSLANRTDVPGGFIEGVSITIDDEYLSVFSPHFRRPMRLTVRELAALDLGLAMLRAERTPDEHAVMEQARERLSRALAEMPADEPAAAIAPRIASLVELSPAATAIHKLLRQAARDRRRATIRYRKASDTDASARVICPYGLIFSSGSWYVVAHCERSEALRVFRLDRIEGVELADGEFEQPEGFSFESVVREGRVFHTEDPVETASIRYSPAIARWIAEREGVPLADDGSLTMEYPLGDDDWMMRHVLQYGPDAEVVEPSRIRVRLREVLRSMATG